MGCKPLDVALRRMSRTTITKELVTVKAEENLSDTKMSSSFNGNTVDEDETQHSGLGDDDEEMSADEVDLPLPKALFVLIQSRLIFCLTSASKLICHSRKINRRIITPTEPYKEVVMENGKWRSPSIFIGPSYNVT